MESQTDTTAAEFSWQAHPAAERHGRAAVAVLFIIAFSVAVYGLLYFGGVGSAAGMMTVGQCVLWSAVVGLVLFLTLHRFFFPTRYTIDAEGITYRHLMGRQSYRWEQIQRFFLDENGGFLMTSTYRPRLRPLQGVHLQFGSVRDEAVRRIRQYLHGGEAA